MKIDTLFTSKSGKLYAGWEDGNGKFSGQTVYGGRLRGNMRTKIEGTIAAKFETPVTLADDSDALPTYASIMVERAVLPISLGQYLTTLDRIKEREAAAASKEAPAKTEDEDGA